MACKMGRLTGVMLSLLTCYWNETHNFSNGHYALS